MNDVSKILTIALVTLLQACSTPSSTVANPAKATATTTATTPEISSAEPLENAVEKADSEPVQVAAQKIADRPRVSQQPEYCAPENYRQFFWNFVKDNDMKNNRMRAPYTSSEIKVRDYNNPQKILEVVRKEDYQGFKISAIDYTMVYDDRSITDPNAKARLKLDFKRRTEDVFRVNYVKAEFETNPEAEDNNGKLIRTYGVPGAYVFVHRNGCWNLTAEERTPVSGTDRTAGPRAEFLEGKLTKGMAYADLRKTALMNGWVPLTSPDCKDNVGGPALVCNEIPEVNACSGDGYCLMFFNHQNSETRLSVTTYGPYDDWQTPGKASRLRVKNWGMGDAAKPLR